MNLIRPYWHVRIPLTGDRIIDLMNHPIYLAAIPVYAASILFGALPDIPKLIDEQVMHVEQRIKSRPVRCQVTSDVVMDGIVCGRFKILGPFPEIAFLLDFCQ